MPDKPDIRLDPPADPLPTEPEARQALAQALRTVPGQWVLIGTAAAANRARTHAYALRNGDPGWRAFGAGFEAEMHFMLGEARVYARYVGTTASTGGKA